MIYRPLGVPGLRHADSRSSYTSRGWSRGAAAPNKSSDVRLPLRATRRGAGILRRRFAHDGLEVADEVRLVEVAEVLS